MAPRWVGWSVTQRTSTLFVPRRPPRATLIRAAIDAVDAVLLKELGVEGGYQLNPSRTACCQRAVTQQHRREHHARFQDPSYSRSFVGRDGSVRHRPEAALLICRERRHEQLRLGLPHFTDSPARILCEKSGA
jgi:hypothetical protein